MEAERGHPARREALNRQIAQAPSAAALLGLSRRSLPDFDSVHVSTCLRRLALLRRGLTPELLDGEALGELAQRQRQDLAQGRADGFGVASAAWTLAKLGGDAPLLLCALPELVAAAAATARGMSAQGLATTIWALAMLDGGAGGVGPEAAPFVSRFLPEARARLAEFGPQDLAFSAWGLAVLGVRDTALLASISARSVGLIEEFQPQGLAGLSFGFALLQLPDRALLVAVAAKSSRSISRFSPDDLIKTAYAFVSLTGPGPGRRARTRAVAPG